MRDAIADYCDRIAAASFDAPSMRRAAESGERPDLLQIRSMARTLLADVPERDNVLVFRNEEHCIAWAWLLDALRAVVESSPPATPEAEAISEWLFELIDFLLTVRDRRVEGSSDGPEM